MVKEFEGDARSILSKLHHYHTQSNVAQHEVVTLTTYNTNLSLTDSRKGITRQFLCHFKEKLRLLNSLVPDTDKIPETVRITFLQRAVQQNHDLRQIHVLVLCGDPKQDQQEDQLLRFIMIYFDVMILNMILEKKTLQMTKIKMNLPHTQSFNLPSILLYLRNLSMILFPINSGESSPKLQSRW